uniref:Androglobin n=1 Tax=Anser cygnoides TaxID=8845 RepID=A0A8B9EQN5_ANSCY
KVSETAKQKQNHLKSNSRFPIWPEWNEADINAEKWDAGKVGKEKEKSGKSPISHVFDDPEGKIELPASLKVHSWKRPQEFLTNKVRKNKHFFFLHSSVCFQMMRWIISEICAVWRMYNGKDLTNGTSMVFWKPWEHIYALCKATKGHMPLYNSYGKYIVKLYWMGCWRKITVDDTMPFNEEDNLLLPATTCQIELWPMLLSKAIIKLANTSIHENGKRELEEFTVLHALTGWIPEVIPLQPGYLNKVWDFLKEILPEFKLTNEETSELDNPRTDTKCKETKVSELKNEVSSVNKQPDKPGKAEKFGKGLPVNVFYLGSSVRTQPDMAVYAGFIPLHLFEAEVFSLDQMAGSSENLRQYGLLQVYSHPVLVTRTRSCPLVAPPQPPPVPRWKRFRQKKETVVTSEPQEPVIKKPEQYIEIASPFLNYKLNPITIPKDCIESVCLLISAEELHENISSDAKQMSETAATDMNSQREDKSKEEIKSEITSVSKETWISFEDFCILKCLFSIQSTDDRVLYYLLVDSLKSTEILVSFSALVRWDIGATKQEASSTSKAMLMVEHFSWKCATPGEHVLKMHTYATKATVLNLPVGRHILLFTVSSPIGYHIHLCSMVPCVFGEEDAVIPSLEKESFRFIEQATAILKAIGNVINNFSNKPELSEALKELKLAHCPPGLHGTGMAEEHFKSSEVNSPGSWQKRIPTFEEEAAALKLQAIWRGAYVRKVLNSRKPGVSFKSSFLKKNISCFILFKCLSLFLLSREMFKKNCKSVEKFPCYEDEWCKVSFADYAVTYADQPPNIWFVIFREIFIVPEDMLIVPKMYTTIPSCRLHVVDNDTLEEMPHVFFKVTPQVYPKNKKGYTFMAEARSGDLPVAAGRWRLRLIGSHSPLPFLSREAVNNIFSTKEIKEYYIPNEKRVMFRYSVKVTASHITTVQVQTSESDVFFKLQVLDNEEEIVSVTGKGHAVIPAFNFLSSETHLSSNGSKTQIIQSITKKDSETGGLKKKGHISTPKGTKASSKPGPLKEGLFTLEEESLLLENFENNHGSPQQSHKYIIQALVLYNSWPLTESQLQFVQTLKEMEKNEIKEYGEKHEECSFFPALNNLEGQRSASVPKSTRKSKEKTTEKTEKDKSNKERGSLMSLVFQPEYQQAALNKPYWTLRLVSEQREAEVLEVKKDTQRADEIKAMKQAWESAEPGRAVKAFQERMKFINKHAARDSEESVAEADVASLTPRSEERGKGITFCQAYKYICFSFRKTMSESMLRNESIIQQREIHKLEKINHFRELRELVLEQREKEQNARALLKQNILEMYEKLQVDETRGQVHSIREAYRSKLLEAERRKRDKLAAQEAILQTEQEKKSPDARKKKQGKGLGKRK